MVDISLIFLLLFYLNISVAGDLHSYHVPTHKAKLCADYFHYPDIHLRRLKNEDYWLPADAGMGGLYMPFSPKEGGGLCWWHSRFNRNVSYLVYLDPFNPKPTSKEAKKLIRKIIEGKNIVAIPGYRNLQDFYADHIMLINSALSSWQDRDIVSNIFNLPFWEGQSSMDPQKLEQHLDDLYQKFIREQAPLFLMLNLNGWVGAHSVLLIGMHNTGEGYQLDVLDVGFPTRMEFVKNTTRNFQMDGRTFLPYLQRESERIRLAETVDRECQSYLNEVRQDYQSVVNAYLSFPIEHQMQETHFTLLRDLHLLVPELAGNRLYQDDWSYPYFLTLAGSMAASSVFTKTLRQINPPFFPELNELAAMASITTKQANAITPKTISSEFKEKEVTYRIDALKVFLLTNKLPVLTQGLGEYLASLEKIIPTSDWLELYLWAQHNPHLKAQFIELWQWYFIGRSDHFAELFFPFWNMAMVEGKELAIHTLKYVSPSVLLYFRQEYLQFLQLETSDYAIRKSIFDALYKFRSDPEILSLAQKLFKEQNAPSYMMEGIIACFHYLDKDIQMMLFKTPLTPSETVALMLAAKDHPEKEKFYYLATGLPRAYDFSPMLYNQMVLELVYLDEKYFEETILGLAKNSDPALPSEHIWQMTHGFPSISKKRIGQLKKRYQHSKNVMQFLIRVEQEQDLKSRLPTF